jgi:hypothetical protein
VPHRGWECTGIEDLGAPLATCEMCEVIAIRYVNYMEHPDYFEALGCGCICAGNMECDSQAAVVRETGMKSRAGKRERWLSHRRWRVSRKGNPWIQIDGYRVTVYPRGEGWGATVAEYRGLDLEEKLTHSRLNYETQAKAKLAAFDLITRIETRKQLH